MRRGHPAQGADPAAASRTDFWFYRGSEPVDEAWIGETLNRMAVLLAEQNLAEIEVNPAFADKNGGTIVDALCVRAAAPTLVHSPNS